MYDTHITLLFIMLSTVVLFWLTPHTYRMVLVAVITLLFLSYQSTISALFLMTSSVMTFFCAKKSLTDNKQRSLYFIIVILSSFFLLFHIISHHLYHLPLIIGFSYVICRQIHFIVEVSRQNITSFTLKDYLVYQFYLPVIYSGPVHRYDNFTRQIERMHFDYSHFSLGIERVIYGYFKLIVISNYLINGKLSALVSTAHFQHSLFSLYLTSCMQWISLYLAFSGLTDVALGFSSMMGLKLEENFNSPYKATNLIDFWQRWHISLTSWVRDYVFKPVFLKSRSQILAVFSALIVIAVWHEVSWHYFLWGIYQAVGILLCRTYQIGKDLLAKLPWIMETAIKRFATFFWLLSFLPLMDLLGITYE